MSERHYSAVFKTSAGWVLAEATQMGITRLSLPSATRPVLGASPVRVTQPSALRPQAEGMGHPQGGPEGPRAPAAAKRHIAALRRQLQAYFAGRPVRFRVSLDLSSLPAFTAAVLRAAAKIPYGEVRTYAGLARAVGEPGAARAVGQAMKRNPVPVVIPCHRVLAARGLGGYSAGLRWKRRLLRLEGCTPR